MVKAGDGLFAKVPTKGNLIANGKLYTWKWATKNLNADTLVTDYRNETMRLADLVREVYEKRTGQIFIPGSDGVTLADPASRKRMRNELTRLGITQPGSE